MSWWKSALVSLGKAVVTYAGAKLEQKAEKELAKKAAAKSK